MNHDSDKTYKLPDWPEETEKPAETPRPRRRKRHVPEEPSDFWGKLRFRTGKKLRWFGRRSRRVIREAKAQRFPESNRLPLQFLLMLWGLLPSAASGLAEKIRGRRKEKLRRSGRLAAWIESRFDDKKKREHSLIFLGGSCVLAGIILFFSFFTIGTTVTYDGTVLGAVASKKEAESARKEAQGTSSDRVPGPIAFRELAIFFLFLAPAGRLLCPHLSLVWF